MRAGRLDTRVTIWSRTVSADPKSNEQIETFKNLGTVWAEELTPAAVERVAGNERVAEFSCAFKMRGGPALSTLTPDKHRISKGAFIFEIAGVIEVRRGQGVIALCKARAEGINAKGEAV